VNDYYFHQFPSYFYNMPIYYKAFKNIDILYIMILLRYSSEI